MLNVDFRFANPEHVAVLPGIGSAIFNFYRIWFCSAFKGTVFVTLRYPPCLKSCVSASRVQNIQYQWLANFTAETKRKLSELYIFQYKNRISVLYTSIIFTQLGFKGYCCESYMPLYKWKFTWKYVFNPFEALTHHRKLSFFNWKVCIKYNIQAFNSKLF